MMSSQFVRKLLTCTAITTMAISSVSAAHAADQSAAIEAGGTVNIDGADTFTIDGVNDGVGAGTSVVFTNNAGSAIDSLTVGSSGGGGGGADNNGEIGSINILDNNGTNTLTVQDAADAFNNTDLTITGDVNGNVATNANDLNITVDSTAGAADSDGIIEFQGNVDLGSGMITLTGNGGAGDNSILIFNQGADAAIIGRIISTSNDSGSFIFINNVGTLTFNDSIGQAGSGGIGNLLLGASVADGALSTEAFGTVVFNDTVDANAIDIDANDGGASIADFNGDVTGSTIALEGGNTDGETAFANFAGNVNVTSITLDDEAGSATNDAVIIFDGNTAQSITGTITGAGDGEGQITVATGAEVTFNSGIGGGANDIRNFVVQSGATATLNSIELRTQQNATGVGPSIDVDGTLILDASTATIRIIQQNVGTGHDYDFDGTLSAIGSNNVIISERSGNDLTIDGIFSTVLSGTSKTISLDSSGGTFSIGANSDTTITAGNQIVTGSAVTFGAGGRSNTLNIRKTADFDPTATAVINAVGDVVTVAGTLTVGIDTSSLDFNAGNTVTVIDSDQNATTSYATLIGNGSIVFRDTAFLDLQDNGSDAQDLKFIVALKSTPDGASAQTSDALTQSVTATSGDAEAQAALLALTSEQSNDAGLQLLSDSSGGAATTQATAGNMASGFDIVSARLSDLRTGNARGQTGLSSGDRYSDRHVWLRAFGVTAEQDLRSGVQGYNVDTVGAMAGMDALLDNNVRLGVNASYAVTNVDTDGAGHHETDIDTYRIGVYGGKDFDKYYLEGQASFAYNDIESSRNITFGALNRAANADTKGYEYGVRVGAGMPLAIDNAQTITPHMALQYIHAEVNDYTETGAGALNARIDNENIDVLELALGVKYNTAIDYDSGTFKPELRAAAAYDFIGDTAVSSQTFTGGGSTFQVRGADPAQFSINYGAGIRWETKDEAWEFSLDYDGKAKSDYISHGARMEAKLRF